MVFKLRVRIIDDATLLVPYFDPITQNTNHEVEKLVLELPTKVYLIEHFPRKCESVEVILILFIFSDHSVGFFSLERSKES